MTVTLLLACWAAFVLVGNSWWQLVTAAVPAVIFTQLGFLGHDAGHRQISGSRRVSAVLGVLVGNLGIGMSYGWWIGKHTRHHAHPNTEGADPDISVGALAFTPSQAAESRGPVSVLFAAKRTCSSRCCSARRLVCTYPASARWPANPSGTG